MARGQQQLDFRGAEQDATNSFAYRMTRRREQLERIPFANSGLSKRRWEQVRECIMAITSYTLAGQQPERAKLLRTSGLSRDQWYVARENALALGLIEVERSYVGERRLADQLSVVDAAIEALARGRPPNRSDQRRTTPNNTEQLLTTPNSSVKFTNPRAPAGAALDLPKNLTNRETTTKSRETLGEGWDPLVVEVSLCGVNQAQDAIASVVKQGGTPADVSAIVAAWRALAPTWRPEYAPAVLYRRLKIWRTGQDAKRGWPPAHVASRLDVINEVGSW